jgi:hypothetical protein
MSPVAAEGLALPRALQALVGSDERALAASICRLHADAALHQRVAKAGLAMIRKRYSEPSVRSALAAAVDGRVVSRQAAQ